MFALVRIWCDRNSHCWQPTDLLFQFLEAKIPKWNLHVALDVFSLRCIKNRFTFEICLRLVAFLNALDSICLSFCRRNIANIYAFSNMKKVSQTRAPTPIETVCSVAFAKCSITWNLLLDLHMFMDMRDLTGQLLIHIRLVFRTAGMRISWLFFKRKPSKCLIRGEERVSHALFHLMPLWIKNSLRTLLTLKVTLYS